MGSDDFVKGLPGGRELSDWFGGVPRFHDAELLRIDLTSGSGGSLHIHAWNMTEVVDARGFFVTDKHALVTINLSMIRRIELVEFHLTGIIFSLDGVDARPGTDVSWTSSCGVEGRILADEVSFEVKAHKPASTNA